MGRLLSFPPGPKKISRYGTIDTAHTHIRPIICIPYRKFIGEYRAYCLMAHKSLLLEDLRHRFSDYRSDVTDYTIFRHHKPRFYRQIGPGMAKNRDQICHVAPLWLIGPLPA